jgi:putative tricarboxylic transport membrane protein
VARHKRQALANDSACTLAPIAESRLRQGLMMTDGSYMPLVTQPLTLSLLIVSALLLFWPILRGYWPARR